MCTCVHSVYASVCAYTCTRSELVFCSWSAGEAEEEEEDAGADEEDEELEPMDAVEEEEDDEIEPDEGNELVDADEEGDDMLYQMREEDPEISLENVAAFEAAADNETEMEVDLSAGMPAGFLGTPVSGTVGVCVGSRLLV